VTYPFPAMLWSLSAFPPQVRQVDLHSVGAVVPYTTFSNNP